MSWNWNLPPGCTKLPGEDSYPPEWPLKCRHCGGFVRQEPDDRRTDPDEGIVHLHTCKRCGGKTPTTYYI
jgi:hypothetical protein